MNIYNEISVDCNFNLKTERDKAENIESFYFSWDEAEIKEIIEDPYIELYWKTPLVDIQYFWYPTCKFDRSLRVDWQQPIITSISTTAPVFCFFNNDSRNRLTIALSDYITRIGCSLGVHEEDDTLLCRIRIPLNGKINSYKISIYRDYADKTFSEALSNVRKWWESLPNFKPAYVPSEAQLPIYSTWYSFHQQLSAEEIELECKRAAELGMSSVIVDDGWQTGDNNRGYAYCGDWEPDFGKMANMKEHVKRVHSLNMKYILWFSVPFIGSKSKNYSLFKDKLLYETMGAGVLDPRYPDVRDYIISHYIRAVKEWDVDGLKLDFIDSIRSGDITKSFNKDMDFRVVEEAVNQLMHDAILALKKIKPNILIEFRQSYTGPQMCAYGNMMRVADCPGSAITNRVGIVDLRLISGSTAVHSDMLTWNTDESPENVACQLISCIFGVPQISVRLDKIPQTHKKVISFWIDFARNNVDLLQNAQIQPEQPQHLYPIVRTIKDDRSAIAVYAPGFIVDLNSKVREIFILNATSKTEVPIKCIHQGHWHIDILSCTGDIVDSLEKVSAGMFSLHIPIGGMARLISSSES